LAHTEYVAGFEFRYGCEVSQLAPPVARHWRPLGLSAAGRDFIESCFAAPHSSLIGALHSCLRLILSDFDVNGLLGTHPLFLLATEQWEQLLQRTSQAQGSLLDIGAGNGDVTSTLAPLFSEVRTTEQSKAMVRRLRRRGFQCRVAADGEQVVGASGASETFDVVCLLNVLDRTSHPSQALRAAADRVRSAGRLVVSMPLPQNAFCYRGPRVVAPQGPMPSRGDSWEQQCSSLGLAMLDLLPEFELRSVSRCPYISGGDQRNRLYVLDDALFVLARTGGTASIRTD